MSPAVGRRAPAQETREVVPDSDDRHRLAPDDGEDVAGLRDPVRVSEAHHIHVRLGVVGVIAVGGDVVPHVDLTIGQGHAGQLEVSVPQEWLLAVVGVTAGELQAGQRAACRADAERVGDIDAAARRRAVAAARRRRQRANGAEQCRVAQAN